MNVLSFTGHIGQDATTRYTTNGTAMASFSVALQHGYGDKKGTAWMRCSLFGQRAESLAPYLTKGQLVGITGSFEPREYKKEGETRISLDLRVSDVTLLGKRDDAPKQERQPAGKPETASDSGFGDFDSDVPF